MAKNGLLVIKPHTRKKYDILSKYLRVCERFSDKYQNFAYIDTHGGSGKVLDIDLGQKIDGSSLIAAKITPRFPCYVVEIDPDRYACLEESTREFTNITLFEGDCNEKINKILESITPGEKFVFVFLDPDGLVYERANFCCYQLTAKTVDTIATFPRTEILLNFPLEALMRCGGYARKLNDAVAEKYADRITNYFGTEEWMTIDLNGRKLLEFYIAQRLDRYPYRGAILIRTEQGSPQYYLVYASNHNIGAKIMRDIMKNEWGYEPLLGLDTEFPLERFIFDVPTRGTRKKPKNTSILDFT